MLTALLIYMSVSLSLGALWAGMNLYGHRRREAAASRNGIHAGLLVTAEGHFA